MGENGTSSLATKDRHRVYRYWDTMSSYPGGKWLFSYMIGKAAPYTGTISPYVCKLEPGFSKVTMKDRRSVRNHLKSVHAIALSNLIEVTGNLALISRLPSDARFIITEMTTKYHKKARGQLTGTAEVPEIETNEETEYEIDVEIRDEDGEVTTTGIIHSLVGPS